MAEEAIDLSRHFESEGETDLIIAEDDEEEPELADDDDVCQEMLVPIVEITEDTENNWKLKRRRKRVKTKNGFSPLPTKSIDESSTNGQPSTSRFQTSDGEQPTCSNCNTQKTSMWRRDKSANLVCNACGLYIKLYGVNRPIQMRKDTVRVRRRKSAKETKKEENEKHQPKNPLHKPKPLPVDISVVRNDLSNVHHEGAILPTAAIDLANFFPSNAKPFPMESVSLKSGLSRNLPSYVKNLCVNLSNNEDIVTITPTRSKEIKKNSSTSQAATDMSVEIKKIKTNNVDKKFPAFGKNSAVEITLVKPKVTKQHPTTSNFDWEVSVLPKPPPLKKRPLPKIESMSQVLMQKAMEAQQNDLSEAYGQIWDKLSHQTSLLQKYNLLNSQHQPQTANNGGLPMPDFRGLQPLKLKEQVNPKRARIEHSSLDVSPASLHLTPNMLERLQDNFTEGSIQSHLLQHQQQRSTKVSSSTSCANCNTQQTSIWRRNKLGLPICNACGLYFRLHGVDRPVNLRNDVIRKRMRKGDRKLKTSKKDYKSSENLVETYEDELIDQSDRHLLAD